MDSLYHIVADHMKDLSIPGVLRTFPSDYNYSWYWAFIDLKGKERYGVTFKLHPNDVNIFIKLIAWYIKDQRAAEAYTMRLDAGLLLSGPVGCGKTSLARLCSMVASNDSRPGFKACREIGLEVEIDGAATILHYTRHSFDITTEKPRTWILDDLGLEANVNHYGTLLSPMGEILLGRYDYWVSHRMQTIITTNLTSEQIESRYGSRVRSRLREMMNLVTFSASAIDKR